MRKVLLFNKYRYEYSNAGLRAIVKDSGLTKSETRELKWVLWFNPPSQLHPIRYQLVAIMVFVAVIGNLLVKQYPELWFGIIILSLIGSTYIHYEKSHKQFLTSFELVIEGINRKYNLDIRIGERP